PPRCCTIRWCRRTGRLPGSTRFVCVPCAGVGGLFRRETCPAEPRRSCALVQPRWSPRLTLVLRSSSRVLPSNSVGVDGRLKQFPVGRYILCQSSRHQPEISYEMIRPRRVGAEDLLGVLGPSLVISLGKRASS